MTEKPKTPAEIRAWTKARLAENKADLETGLANAKKTRDEGFAAADAQLEAKRADIAADQAAADAEFAQVRDDFHESMAAHKQERAERREAKKQAKAEKRARG